MEYSNILAPTDPAFWRLCDDTGCHCDFRLTITHCKEHKALYILNIIDIVWSSIGAIIAVGILYFRIYYRNQQIFDFSGKVPRPKPIESMAFFGVIFNLFRCINAAVLLADTAKYPIFRAFMFEIPWQVGIAALSSYLFGIVHTLSNSSRHLYTTWVGSQFTVDIASLVVLILPVITINPIAIIAAHYAQIGDTVLATRWTQAIYVLWLVYTFLLGSLVLLAGIRLLRLLKIHLLAQEENNGDQITKIQLGATKVKIIIGIACFCLWIYSLMIAFYAFARYEVMINEAYTITITALALFNGPLATTIIEFALILNVSILNGLGNLSFGSSHGSQSQKTTQKDTRNFSLSNSMSGQSKTHHILSTSSHSQGGGGSNRIQLELWTRLDTQACLSEQDEENGNQHGINKQLQNNHKNNNITGLTYSSSFSSTINTYQRKASVTSVRKSMDKMDHHNDDDIDIDEDDDNNNNNHHGHHQMDLSDMNSLSKIEEEQRYYNQMTNQLRKPPPSLSYPHRQNYSGHSNSNPYDDGNESVSSAAHLVGP
ncbi:unnamed protein product [Cunninghamella blakesleeana]